MNDKVKLSEIVEALLRGEWLSRRDLANRIEAHGIEQGGEPVAWYKELCTEPVGYSFSFGAECPNPYDRWVKLYTAPPSIDALIAEIDGLDVPPMVKLKLGFITDKYRGQK